MLGIDGKYSAGNSKNKFGKYSTVKQSIEKPLFTSFLVYNIVGHIALEPNKSEQ